MYLLLFLSSQPETPSSISCTLWLMFVYIVAVCLNRIFQIRTSLSLCFLYSFYFHFYVLNIFINFLQLFVFPYFSQLSLRDVLHSSKCFFLFPWISLRNLFMSSLRTWIIFLKLGLKYFSCAFCCVEIFCACYKRIAGSWHIVLLLLIALWAYVSL